MSEKLERLKTLLRELFQLDQPDLDFGIYRIMHAKAREVTGFLDTQLLPQVRTAFEQYQPASKAEIQKELDEVIAGVRVAGMDPDQSPRVKELRDRIANEAVDLDQLEAEVYDHLYQFFRRYYSEGDFLSKRVYKPGVYAIPYEGEEVKLHWANKDQYYIKTSEYLRDYAFKLQPDDDRNPMRVHFRLVDAAEGEHGNVKSTNERRFILAEGGESGRDYVAIEDGELVIAFEYRPSQVSDWAHGIGDAQAKALPDKPPSQAKLIELAANRILSVNDDALQPWIAELSRPHVKTNGETADHNRLVGHLNRYAARHTFDYFIHKDLGGFLRRELDFYIKNEVMHLDDVENETAPRVEQYLSKIRVVRKIAHKLIDFVAQLEHFQKRLWLKKKFVVETNYCITLDRIPEEFYEEIAGNEAQRSEWVQLFSINTTENDLITPAYSEPLAVEFLRAHKYLIVDTRHFDDDFVFRLIAGYDVLDAITNGLLIHSDNFQAACLIGPRYREQVKCIYLDPPYNTDSSSIPYKNNYRHSTWITMIKDRLASLRSMLTIDGAVFVSIDKTERAVLENAMDEVFDSKNRIEELIWSMNTNNSQAPNYSTNHEYVEVYARDRRIAEQDRNMFREPKPGFEEVMSLIARINLDYPAIADIESQLDDLYEQHLLEFRDQIESLGLEWEDEKGNDPWKGLYNYSHAEYRDAKGRLVPDDQIAQKQARIWIWREADSSMPAAKQAQSTRDPEHKNWRFYNPMHPITRLPCPHPKSGWKFAFDDDIESPDRRSFASLDRDHRIAWGQDEKKVPQLKRFLHEVETNVGKSVFQDYSDGEKQLSAMFGKSGLFLAPKHADFVSRFILHSAKDNSTILDFFGGSGSTAHAVIKLNRDDKGKRKYLLAEIGDYFDALLKPRVLKAVYASQWRAGRPVSRDGVSHVVKFLRLESYEDALNNLYIRTTGAQRTLLEDSQAQAPDGLREQYILRYMLDVETRGSQSLLNIDFFIDPTAYKLKVKRPGTDESREVNVDLMETFNWLIGLTVKHSAAPQTFAAGFKRDNDPDLPKDAPRRLLLDGRLRPDPVGPWWFRTVTGTTPDGRKTLIIWRKRPGGDSLDGLEQDNLVLNEWFTKSGYSTRDLEFDLIYVNGDNNLENLKAPDDTWKVRLIEEDFHRLMFDVDDI